jgi:hypothetical protein
MTRAEYLDAIARRETGRVFVTTLISSNFALNAATDHGAALLAKLFPGMSEETAANIIERGEGRLLRPARNSVWVPNDLLGGDNAG